MKILNYILLASACLLSSQAPAQVLSLDSVLSNVEKYNPMLKMYDNMEAAENMYAEGARSWMPPVISAGLWQTPYTDVSQGMFMISAEQMIPNPAKLKANQKYMLGMAPVNAEGKLAQRNILFAQTKQAYYEWMVMKKKRIVLEEIDSLLAYLLQTAQLRYTYNKERLDNIYKTKADLYDLRNNEYMLDAEMKMKNVMLNTLMDRKKDFVFDVDTLATIHHYETITADSNNIASSRSDVKQLEASRALLKLQQNYDYSQRLPDFGISANHMQSLGIMPNQFSIMCMITIPIAGWSAKMYRSEVAGLKAQMNAVDDQQQELMNMAAGNIAVLQVEIKEAKQELNNYRNNVVPAYNDSYRAALLSYEQNTGDLFVVLDAFKMYRMESMSELDELGRLLNLQVEYEKEMEIR